MRQISGDKMAPSTSLINLWQGSSALNSVSISSSRARKTSLVDALEERRAVHDLALDDRARSQQDFDHIQESDYGQPTPEGAPETRWPAVACVWSDVRAKAKPTCFISIVQGKSGSARHRPL